MHMSVVGALVGLGIGIVLVVFELMQINSAIAERAKRTHRPSKMDATEYKALRGLISFCLLLPPILAFAFWAIWG